MRPAPLIAAAAAAWVLLLLAAPASVLGVPVSASTYLFGSFICHQKAERSFHLAAAQLPVCARCFGLYAGAAAVLCLAALERAARGGCSTRPLEGWRSASALRAVLLAGAVPTAVTWSAEALGFPDPGNAVRFAAALPLGAAVALTVNYVECARTRPSGSRRPPTPL